MTQVDHGDTGRVFGSDISILNGSSNCVVIFHGYSDTPYEFKHVAREISTLGVDVIVPVLPHHGIDSSELSRADLLEADKWGARLLAELKPRYEKVLAVGHSMGSGIVSYAIMEGISLDGIIITSVNGVPSGNVRFFLKLARALRITSFKPVYKELRHNHFEPQYIEWKLKHFPRIYFNVFFEAIETLPVYIMQLPKITVPIMVIHGAKDFAANVTKTSDLYFEKVRSTKKTMIIVEKTGHAVFFSRYFEQIMQEIKAFIQDVLIYGDHGPYARKLRISRPGKT